MPALITHYQFAQRVFSRLAPGGRPGCRPGRGLYRSPGARFVFLPPRPAVGAGEKLRARGRADA